MGGDNIGRKSGWTLEQWRWNYAKTNGSVDANDSVAVQELSSDVYKRISGNQFSYYDHPGLPIARAPGDPLKSAVGKWKFQVKALNGKKECSVDFYINLTFDGTWHAEWGQIRP